MGSAAVSQLTIYPVISAADMIDEWTRGAMELLDDRRDVEILALRLGLDDGEKRTLEKVGQRLRITRERVRQLQRKALVKLAKLAATDYAEHTEGCIVIVEALCDRVGESPDSQGLCDALAYVAGGGASAKLGLLRQVVQESARLAAARNPDLRDADPPPWDEARLSERKTLEAVDSRVIRSIMESASSVLFIELQAAVRRDPAALGALRDWSALDLRLRAEIMLGVRVDEVGFCELTERAHSRLSKRTHRLLALTSVIRNEGKPLHYKEISRRIRPMLPSKFAMSDRNVHAWIDRYKDRFKWAGPGIYGLAEWDIGVHADNLDQSLRPARRTGIGDEIALLLTERGEPIAMSELEEHILGRFKVNRASVSASVSQDKAQRFRTVPGGKVALSAWRD